MPSSFITVATQGLFLSSLAAAVPAPSNLRGTIRSLLATRDGWEGASDGNVKIQVSNDMVNWGQGRVDGGMLDWAMDECSWSSCGGNGKTSETTTRYVNGWNDYDLDIKLNVDGKFVTDGDGTWDHLKEIADVTLKEFEDVEAQDYTDMHGCGSEIWCKSMAEKNRNGDDGPMMIGWYPREVHIVVEDENGSLRAFLDVTLSNDKSEATWDGLCSDLTTAGSALSGLISGIAGAAFSLAGLSCAD